MPALQYDTTSQWRWEAGSGDRHARGAAPHTPLVTKTRFAVLRTHQSAWHGTEEGGGWDEFALAGNAWRDPRHRADAVEWMAQAARAQEWAHRKNGHLTGSPKQLVDFEPSQGRVVCMPPWLGNERAVRWTLVPVGGSGELRGDARGRASNVWVARWRTGDPRWAQRRGRWPPGPERLRACPRVVNVSRFRCHILDFFFLWNLPIILLFS